MIEFFDYQEEIAIPKEKIEKIQIEITDSQKLFEVVMKDSSNQFNNGHKSKRYSLFQALHLHTNDTKKSNTSYIDTAAESSIDYKESLSGIIQEQRVDWKKIKRNSEMIDCRAFDFKQLRKYQSDMMNSEYNPSLFLDSKKPDHQRSRSNILQSTKPMIIQEQKENQIKQSLKSIIKQNKSEISQVSIVFEHLKNDVLILPLNIVSNQNHDHEKKIDVKEKIQKMEIEKAMIFVESPEPTKVDLNTPLRKNTCLKKKVTVRRDSSQLEAQDEQNGCIKSKKVIFKPNQNILPVQKPKILQMVNSQIKKSKKQNVNIKIGDSITSIASKIMYDTKIRNQSRKMQLSINQSSIKSSKTLHDLGGNNFVHRIKCKDKNIKQRAILEISIPNKDQQQREVQIHNKIKQLKHPNIITVYSISKNNDQKGQKSILCKTIDFYPFNLQQYISDPEGEDYSLEKKELQRKIILFQIIKGLHHLHKNNIYHRNLNPSSILLNERLEVVIFNFSSIDYPEMKYKAPIHCKWLIRPPQIILQPNYSYGSAGDIWQLGCLAVYLVKHKMPFIEYSDSNLIIQMIKCMGPITKEDQNALDYKNSSAFLFPKLRKQSMERTFKCQQFELLELLKKIFLFNPSRRETAIELLKDDYFNDLKSEPFRKQYGKRYSLQALFRFPEGQLSQQEKIVIVPSWFY